MSGNLPDKKLAEKVKEKIINQVVKSTFELPPNLKDRLKKCEIDSTGLEKKFFKRILENIDIAQTRKIPACQDTGVFEIWVKTGTQLRKSGLNLEKVIVEAVKEGHRKGKLRESMKDGIKPVIHFEFWDREETELILTPRGFGSENYSFLHMLNPETKFKEIKKIIFQDVKEAGSRPCPPFLIGVGLGGTASKAVELSARALTRMDFKPDKKEQKILRDVNKLKIGAGGTGGKYTAIGLKMLKFPSHIAGLAMGVHIGCWCNRVKKIIVDEKT
ncbi:MAG: fumarate hydratase [Elusimicrobiota bacterium]